MHLFFFLATPLGMPDLSSPTRECNPLPLRWKHGVLSTGPPGKPMCIFKHGSCCGFWESSHWLVLFLFNLFIYLLFLFLAALGLHCCARAFSSCGERGLLFVAVHGLLIAVASRCGARALGAWASVVVARGLSSSGTWVQ